MQFLYPSFLIALLAIAIPIIIHLFHFRRFKKVYFTNVKFLKEVKEETSARSKLRNLLVLLSRILAIAFLVFAFAQPFIPQQNAAVKSGTQAVSVFVDNSFSMSSLSQDVPLIEKAKQRARQIVEAYNNEDEFQILTNDFEGRHQRLLSKEDALGMIDEIVISPSVKKLSKITNRQKQVLGLANSENKVSYVISDFQKNISDLEEVRDTSFDINLIPLQSVQKTNISVDSCWFEAPVQMINQTNRLIVKLRNLSDEDREDVRLTLKLDGQVKPLGNVSIQAGSIAFDTVNVTILRTGWHEAEIEITDYPINFDDNYSFAFNVAPEVNVLSIFETQPNKYVNSVFQGNPYFNITNQSSTRLDYSQLSKYKLIIVDELKSVSSGLSYELKQYVNNGGNLLIFPHAQANISSYKSFLSSLNINELINFEEKDREVTEVNTEEYIFNDVFENRKNNLKLPASKGNFSVTRYGNKGEQKLLTYRDGFSFISKYQIGSGNIYLSAAPLDLKYNDLVSNAEIFVPMLYKMAINTGEYSRISYVIGEDNIIETDKQLDESETVYKLKGSAEEFIPQQRNIGSKIILSLSNEIKESGFYSLFLKPENSLATFAFNYDRKESALEYFKDSELKEMAGENVDVIEANVETNFTELIGERSRGIILWKWCIILTLIFLAIEILLLRFWKV